MRLRVNVDGPEFELIIPKALLIVLALMSSPVIYSVSSANRVQSVAERNLCPASISIRCIISSSSFIKTKIQNYV